MKRAVDRPADDADIPLAVDYELRTQRLIPFPNYADARDVTLYLAKWIDAGWRVVHAINHPHVVIVVVEASPVAAAAGQCRRPSGVHQVISDVLREDAEDGLTAPTCAGCGHSKGIHGVSGRCLFGIFAGPPPEPTRPELRCPCLGFEWILPSEFK